MAASTGGGWIFLVGESLTLCDAEGLGRSSSSEDEEEYAAFSAMTCFIPSRRVIGGGGESEERSECCLEGSGCASLFIRWVKFGRS